MRRTINLNTERQTERKTQRQKYGETDRHKEIKKDFALQNPYKLLQPIINEKLKMFFGVKVN
jgi:hypothetical protein